MSQIDTFFNENYDKLYAVAYRMTANSDKASDVLHNSYVKAKNNIHKFQGKSSLYTWVYRIVVNESYNYFEKIKKLPSQKVYDYYGVSETEFMQSIDHEEKLSESLIIDEMREKCLQAFLKCVPKNQRVSFILKCCTDFTHKEIGQILDISEQNVKVTLHRARKRLQELLEMRCGLIDKDKPCKCHLWIKYMRDNNLELPSGYNQIRNEKLKKVHFENMNNIHTLNKLYYVENSISKHEFIEKMKKLSKVL